MPQPSILVSFFVDLTDPDPEAQREAVLDLFGSHAGATARVRVPSGWPEPRPLSALAQVTAELGLQLRLEGPPDALSAWSGSLRQLIAGELASRGPA